MPEASTSWEQRAMRRLIDLCWWLPVNLLQFVLAVSWTAGCIVIALVVRLFAGDTRISLGMARWLWAPVMMRIGGYSYEVTGGDEIDWSRPHFFASNHQSLLDIVLLFRILPVNLHFVVKQELAKVPFLAWYIRAMGMIFVDRANRTRAQHSVQRTADLVAGGKSVLPEASWDPTQHVYVGAIPQHAFVMLADETEDN